MDVNMKITDYNCHPYLLRGTFSCYSLRITSSLHGKMNWNLPIRHGQSSVGEANSMVPTVGRKSQCLWLHFIKKINYLFRYMLDIWGTVKPCLSMQTKHIIYSLTHHHPYTLLTVYRSLEIEGTSPCCPLTSGPLSLWQGITQWLWTQFRGFPVCCLIY